LQNANYKVQTAILRRKSFYNSEFIAIKIVRIARYKLTTLDWNCEL